MENVKVSNDVLFTKKIRPLGRAGMRIDDIDLYEVNEAFAPVLLVQTLKQRGKRYGLQTMCEGGGMANETIVERLLGPEALAQRQ